MPIGHPRDPRKERYWRQLLQRWQHSGLSIRAFCNHEGCSEASFHAWRRTLAQRGCPANPPPAPVTFVPLHLPPPAPIADSPLELLLSNGRRLRIPPGCPAGLLRQVLAVLEDTPC